MSDHIVKAYDKDLAALKSMLSEMGGLPKSNWQTAIDALDAPRHKDWRQRLHADEKIDELEIAVEEKAVLTIAKRQPMANDLRNIMVAIRIAADIERIGDLAKNIAKRSHAIYDNIPPALDQWPGAHGRTVASAVETGTRCFRRHGCRKGDGSLAA